MKTFAHLLMGILDITILNLNLLNESFESNRSLGLTAFSLPNHPGYVDNLDCFTQRADIVLIC